MKQGRRLVLLFSFLLTPVLWFIPVDATAQDSKDEVCPYSLTLAKTAFTRHEPILLKLAIENSADEPLPVSLGYDREGAFIFTVKRPNGSVIELPRKQVREGISRVGEFTVGGRDSYIQQLILNEWYDFADAGVYEIAFRISSRTETEKVCLDKRFSIEITPLDRSQLQQACSELVETVKRNSNNAGNILDAAKALLAVKHPLAVPFLEEALKANRAVYWLVISGLEQIGNEEAVKILIPMLENPNPEDSEFLLARSALSRIQQRTTDPTTLELIKIALARVSY